jgi:hypothetical protein
MFQRYHRGQDALRLIEGLTVRKHTEGSVMASASLARRAGVLLVGSPGVPGGQDARTIRLLRLGVGAIGTGLPLALIAGNWLTGDKVGAKVIVPDSMSGSYYTSMRNMFVGALCALGVFLIFYRHTERQDRCTLFAGVCALLVAFDPTAPPRPSTEPQWINWVHHGAAFVLIFTLGLFCWIIFAEYGQPTGRQPHTIPGRFKAWATMIWQAVKRGGPDSIYLGGGFVIFASGGLALYTGLWPTSWSTGWQSCYLFEAVCVFAFGTAWLAAGIQGVPTATRQASPVRQPALAGS